METTPHDNQHGGENQMLTQDMWTEIRVMRKMGKSIKKISRELAVSKNTIRKALRGELYQPYQRQEGKPTLLSDFMPFLTERAPQLEFNATTLHRELKKKGYIGGYTMVRMAVKPLRDTYRMIEEATARFETPPGLQAQVDWGSKQVLIGGRLTTIKIFVMVLGFSRAIYVEFVLDEKLPTLIACHEHAFAWFTGVPEEILYDNPKTIVLDRATDNARINPQFEDFCRYYGYAPRLCRPYRARTKGKVESGVKYVKRSFLPGQEFASLDAVNEQGWLWIREVADQRIHGTTHEQPAMRFQKETLRPLGNRPPYQLQICQMRRVANDCMVSYGCNQYSVPWKYVHQTVELQERGDALNIYYQGTIIATHRKAPGRYQVMINMEHYRGLGLVPQQLVMKRTASPEVEVRPLAVYEALAGGGVILG